jgi:hypothetical protein
MSMNLAGGKSSFRWNNRGWAWVLRLADSFGWEPAGTVQSGQILGENGEVLVDWDKEGWSGNYFSNECQEVTEEDAGELAAALERALQHVGTAVRIEEKSDSACAPVVGGEEILKAAERSVAELVQSDPTVRRRRSEGESVASQNLPGAQDLEWLRDPDLRERILSFIRFCREGSFIIM